MELFPSINSYIFALSEKSEYIKSLTSDSSDSSERSDLWLLKRGRIGIDRKDYFTVSMSGQDCLPR